MGKRVCLTRKALSLSFFMLVFLLKSLAFNHNFSPNMKENSFLNISSTQPCWYLRAVNLYLKNFYYLKNDALKVTSEASERSKIDVTRKLSKSFKRKLYKMFVVWRASHNWSVQSK